MPFGPAAAEPEPLRNQRNYRITESDRLGAGSLKRKCEQNLAAIELLKRLEAQGREPTADEKRVLVRYVGWGGLPQVFDAWNEEWKEQRERLEQLLTPEELDSARATTLNAHYTAPVVIRAMYAALQRLGFAHGRILEPALGLGHFIGLIHDYFFAAALDKVRPGGLILFITSKGTLDKQDGALREYVASQADLLGAIRLPNDAFKRNANTEVTADIVLLRKRLPGEPPGGPAWKEVTAITNSLGESIAVNEYFAAHPEMMLGEMRLEGRIYGRGEPTLVGNGRDLAEQLAETIALLPRDVFRPEAHRVAPPTFEQSFPAPEHIKPNAYALLNDQIAIRDGDALHILTGLSNQVARRIRGLIRVRDAVRHCLRSQLNGTPDDEVVAAREHLNRSYDSFVARCGPISARANTSAFRGDPDLPLLLSLEQYDEETGRATKAAIFRERTIQKQRPVPQVTTAKEALLVTLNERGCVDLDSLAGLLHRKPSEVLPELKGLLFLDPQTRRWETEDEYLSGNVQAKLAVAEAAALVDEQFRPNVEALAQVQPADLSAIHRQQAARRGVSPLSHAQFALRLQGQSDTDLTQLLGPSFHLTLRLRVTRAPRFELGRLCITASAAQAVPTEEVLRAVARHATGDWGLLCHQDWQQNEEALRQGGRLLSVSSRAVVGCWPSPAGSATPSPRPTSTTCSCPWAVNSIRTP